MKNRKMPSSVERVMEEEDLIISKTDTRGIITYGNRAFIAFSGYSEKELLGSQHNIIRHPDMPRGVFKFLWDVIQDRRECFAYVKNMAKDGSFYWVFAHVTPTFDSKGNIVGYFSARRKPASHAVAIMGELYQSMLAAESRVAAQDACNASLDLLMKVLSDKGTSYEEFIFTL